MGQLHNLDELCLRCRLVSIFNTRVKSKVSALDVLRPLKVTKGLHFQLVTPKEYSVFVMDAYHHQIQTLNFKKRLSLHSLAVERVDEFERVHFPISVPLIRQSLEAVRINHNFVALGTP